MEDLTEQEVILRDTINDGMSVIDKFVNNMTLDEPKVGRYVSEHFLRMHRTLQQSLIRVIYYSIQYIATYYKENPRAFDARNEAAVEWIKDVARNKSYFPFI